MRTIAGPSMMIAGPSMVIADVLVSINYGVPQFHSFNEGGDIHWLKQPRCGS